MAAIEVAAVLLQDKLQILNSDEVIFYPGLRKKLKDAIQKLNEISLLLKHEDEEHDNNQKTPMLGGQFLTKIQEVENVTDMFYLKRAKAKPRRMRSSLLSTPLMSLSPLLRQKYLNNGIGKFISEIKMLEDRHKRTPTSPDQQLNAKETSSFFCLQKDCDGNETSHHWKRISHYAEMETTIIGRKKEADELLARLSNNKAEGTGDEIRVIQVVGEAGSGKTSLVRYVYNSLDVKKEFEVRAWVHVSNEYVYRDVMVDILRQTASSYVKNVDHMKEHDIAEVLVNNLMEKRYLIVLDDVRDVKVWEKLSVAFPDSRNGSSVILTTRDPSLPHRIDLWSLPFKLDAFSDEESRWLLQVKLKEAETCSPDLEDRILKLCHGSPMNIALFGGLLSTTESSEWSSIIEDLESFRKPKYSTFDNLVALSYDRLPPCLRPCFLYLCHHFPKTFGIPLRRLLGLWQAEGLLTWAPHEENLLSEDLAVMYFETLVTRNIVEVSRWRSDGSPKACQVPGLIHEFFCSKSANADPFRVYRSMDKEGGRKQESGGIRRVAELSGIKNSMDSHNDKYLLRAFVSFDTQIRGTPKTDVGTLLKKIVEERGFGLLKVLDLEGVYKPQLPESLRKLYLLRYLGLRLTVLDSLPEFVGNLPCLETLDVKYTNIATLPNSIWTAKNLRHLHVNEVRLDFFHNKPSRALLNNLLTLTGLYVGDKKVVTDVLGKLTSLRKLGLTCHSSAAKAVIRWISSMTNLQSLKLRVVDEYGKPSELELTTLTKHQTLRKLYLMGSLVKSVRFSELFPPSLSLSILTLSMSKLTKDPMEVLGKLKFLKILNLLASSYTGHKMTCHQGDFSELRVLKLWKLEVKEFVVQERAMAKLQELEIRGCDELKTCAGLEEVSTLKELVLTNMQGIFIEAIKKKIKSHVFVKVNDWKASPA